MVAATLVSDPGECLRVPSLNRRNAQLHPSREDDKLESITIRSIV